MAEMNEENKKKHKKAKKKNHEEEIQVKIETLGENPDKVSPIVGSVMAEMNEENMKKHKKAKKKNYEEEIQVKIETLGENPDKVSPLVGYFPSGFDPLKNQAAAAADEPPQATVRVFRHEKRTNRLQIVVSPNNGSQVDFVGTNYSGEATAPQLCTYALGILDKQSKTLKVVPIASNKIFRLEPRVAGVDLSVEEPSKEELTRDEKFQKIKEVTLKYGTAKTNRRIRRSEEVRRKEDPEEQEHLDRKFEGVKINKEALESVVTHSSRNAPPHDSSATTPQMAYPLDKIISKGEWDYLVDILELLQDGAEVVTDGYPSFVCNRLHRLGSTEDEVEKKQLACVFSYINHLIKFKDKNSLEGFSSAKHHKFPSILSQKFSTMFGNPDKKRLEDEKRDLLISYVLVLTLIADNFRTEVADIAKDLRMDLYKLRPHFEHLGCKLVSERKVLLATLPVPLAFPKPKHKRKRN